MECNPMKRALNYKQLREGNRVTKSTGELGIVYRQCAVVVCIDWDNSRRELIYHHEKGIKLSPVT
jgi:hypothetical protein